MAGSRKDVDMKKSCEGSGGVLRKKGAEKRSGRFKRLGGRRWGRGWLRRGGLGAGTRLAKGAVKGKGGQSCLERGMIHGEAPHYARSMDLCSALWSELPFEVLEQVLSFLPVPDLCRYRTVCKRWDQLVCNPTFGALCAQSASKLDASFIAMRYSTGGRRHEGWCLLDLNERRWYTFKDDDQEIRREVYRGIMKMDRGLVCQFLEQTVQYVPYNPIPIRSHPPGHRIVVYNPIARTHKDLPTPPSNFLTSEFYPEMTMVVDSTSCSFKIFLFHNFDTEFLRVPSTPLDSILDDPLMLVYDSATNHWKNLICPFRIRPGRVKGSCVMFQGYLYVFVFASLREERPLWRYNLVEDAWENLALSILDELPISELIVSANRLFLVGWKQSNFDGNLDYDEEPETFQVSELKFPEMTQEMPFETSKADIVGGFDLKRMEYPDTNIPQISVIGFGNSLLFMSKSTGILAAFDLVTRCWDHGFPPNPLKYLPDERCVWVGKQTNLLLPCTTLWQQKGQVVDDR